jgi:hypothetical protein
MDGNTSSPRERRQGADGEAPSLSRRGGHLPHSDLGHDRIAHAFHVKRGAKSTFARGAGSSPHEFHMKRRSRRRCRSGVGAPHVADVCEGTALETAPADSQRHVNRGLNREPGSGLPEDEGAARARSSCTPPRRADRAPQSRPHVLFHVKRGDLGSRRGHAAPCRATQYRETLTCLNQVRPGRTHGHTLGVLQARAEGTHRAVPVRGFWGQSWTGLWDKSRTWGWAGAGARACVRAGSWARARAWTGPYAASCPRSLRADRPAGRLAASTFHVKQRHRHMLWSVCH